MGPQVLPPITEPFVLRKRLRRLEAFTQGYSFGANASRRRYCSSSAQTVKGEGRI